MRATITIAIPTYNRAKDLDKNLSLLKTMILSSNLETEVAVVVSNNHSTDQTDEVVRRHQICFPTGITYYEQESNIGAERNLVFAVSKVDTEFVMLLGDDDYLPEDYLKICVEQIKKNPRLGCITPNYKAVDQFGNVGYIRESDTGESYYTAGFDACLNNAWLAHQLSGLCFRQESLYDEYMKQGVHNLYPQIFFVAYTALRNDVLHLRSQVVSVSNVPQTQKDWDYDSCGLLGDIFDNFSKLGLSEKERGLLEQSVFSREQDRYYGDGDPRKVSKAIKSLLRDTRMSKYGKRLLIRQVIWRHHYSGLLMELFISPIRAGHWIVGHMKH